MLERELFTLIRSTLVAGLPAGVAVERLNNPVVVGINSGPTVYLSTIIPARRVGWMGRRDVVTSMDPETMMRHDETQWLETTLQVSALHRQNPASPTFLTELTAADLCLQASDILQGDAGLAAMGAQRVRPLRVTEIRVMQFINDADQFEANPSFDIVLSHVQIRQSTTPPVNQFVPDTGRV